MNKKTDLLSSKEVAELLNISMPTLREMRNIPAFKRLEIVIGKRVKFSRQAIENYLNGYNDESVPWDIPTGQLTTVSTNDKNYLEVKKNVFDLRGLKHIEPYGALSLLTCLIERSREKNKTYLLISRSEACKKLKYVGFFDQLENLAPLVEWNKQILEFDQYFPPDSLLPITLIERKGEERKTIEQLNTLFIQQGFSEEIGSYTGWLLGELADNALTHGGDTLDDKKCFIQAQRYTLGDNAKCVSIGISDLGQGIQNSLKSNPKYKNLSDSVAVLTAFKNKVSSWEDYHNRGKGLTDVISLAMGNKSILRVSSGTIDFELDFQKENDYRVIKINPPLFKTKGTRFSFLYIDQKFTRKTREEADEFLLKEIEKYEKTKNE